MDSNGSKARLQAELDAMEQQLRELFEAGSRIADALMHMQMNLTIANTHIANILLRLRSLRGH